MQYLGRIYTRNYSLCSWNSYLGGLWYNSFILLYLSIYNSIFTLIVLRGCC